jgi:hypothetical protein
MILKNENSSPREELRVTSVKNSRRVFLWRFCNLSPELLGGRPYTP